MAGVRIQHSTERNCTLTLVDGKRPYREPFDCSVCHRVHVHKTYHLKLDESGACIVSVEIVERLKALPLMGGFRVANEVKAPPAQRVIVTAGQRLVLPELPAIVPHPQLGEPN